MYIYIYIYIFASLGAGAAPFGRNASPESGHLAGRRKEQLL